MSQALSNLPIGAKVKYGKHSVNGEIPEPIIWTIVDKNHTGYPNNSVTLNTTQIIDVRAFDASEPNNPNANRVTYGNNNYQVSNLDQWLNKSDADGKWYQATHEYDNPPSIITSSGETSYVERPGFLHFFTSQERASLLSTTLKVLIPRIDTNAGTIQTINRKVFLLSLAEVGLGTENGLSDGTAISYFTSSTRAKTITEQTFNNTKANGNQLPSNHNAYHYWWLRTPNYADTFNIAGVFNVASGTRENYTAQTGNIGVAPAINLSSSLKVTATTDEDGCYTFIWPSSLGVWVGGVEKYTSNEIRNIFIALDSLRKVSWRDDLDEFISATSGNMIQGWINNNDDVAKCSWWCATGKATSASGVVGNIETMSFTFARALTGVSFAFMNYRYDNSAEAETEKGKIEIYLNNETTPKTSINYTKADTYVNYDLGNVSVGDTIKFRMWTMVGDDSIPNFTIRVLPSCDSIALIPEIVSVPSTRMNDRRVSSVYAGVTATVPKYTETTTTEDVALSTNTFTDFFSADNTGTTGTNAKGITWADNSGGGLKLKFGNYGIDSSTSMTTFTAQRDLTNVVIKGLYYTETRYDKITLIVAGTTVLDAVSGTSSTLTQRWTGSLSKGQTIVLKFVKDSSQSATNESSTYFTLSCGPYQKTTTTQTQIGTETKLVDKKIIKGYVGGPDGKARLFFGGGGFSYTGEYTEQDYISTSGTKYKLYTLTTGGEMKLTQEARYWMCGGGANGGISTAANGARFGGGGGYILDGVLTKGEYTVNVGAGGTPSSSGGWGGSTSTAAGASSIIAADGITKTANGGETNGKGGSAGGGYSKATSSSATSYSSHSFVSGPDGAGVSTIPFGIVTLYPHSPGGGGGSVQTGPDSNGSYYHSSGTYGGSNGGRGGTKNTQGYRGGYKGGGMGGTYGKGGNATFYGGGGGGAEGGLHSYTAGSGYQGVVYIMQKIGTAQSTMVLPLILGDIIKYNQSIYTKVTVGSTTYETETETTVNKGANIMVIACRRGIYYNGTKVVAASTTGTVNYTFTMQTPTLIYCDYNNTYIVTEEGKETA